MKHLKDTEGRSLESFMKAFNTGIAKPLLVSKCSKEKSLKS